MSYENKMLLRMAMPSLAVGLSACFAMFFVNRFQVAFAALGAPVLWPNALENVAVGFGTLWLGVTAYQLHRIWRYYHGEADTCFPCGSLMGRERDGRYGPYQKCLGCGRKRSMLHK